MLKITLDGATEKRLVLEGRLTEPDISELGSAWEKIRAADQSRNCLVDLRNVTFIDPSAETILLEMNSDGARFVACGVCNVYRLEQLGIRFKQPGGGCQSAGTTPTG